MDDSVRDNAASSRFVHHSKDNQREDRSDLPCQGQSSDKLSMRQRIFEWRCLKMPHVAKQVYATKVLSLDDIEWNSIKTPPVQRICQPNLHQAPIVS